MSPSSQLVVKLLHELIAAPYAHTLLALTPAPLMPNLVPLLAPPEAFSYAQLLAITAPKASAGKVDVIIMFVLHAQWGVFFSLKGMPRGLTNI